MKTLTHIVAFMGAMMLTAEAHAYCIGSDHTLPSYQPDYYSVAKEFGRAKLVVEAVVSEETWIGDDGKPKPLIAPYDAGENRPWGIAAPFMGAWYEVEVVRAFKDKVPPRLRLFSENSTGRFWLNKDQRYLLFLIEDQFDEPIGKSLTVDNCGNSARLGSDLTMLRQLQTLGASH